MSLPVPSPRTSGNGFGYIIIGKSLIIIVVGGFITVVLNDIQFPTVIPRNAVTRNLMNAGLLRSRGPGFVGFFAFAQNDTLFLSLCSTTP